MNRTIDNRGYIIAIGAIKVREWDIIDTFYQLVSFSDPNMYIDTYVTVLTGIHDDDLIGQPDFPTALLKLLEWASNCDYFYYWGSADIRSIIYSLEKSKTRNSISNKHMHIINDKFVDLKRYISLLSIETEKMSLVSIYNQIYAKALDMRKVHSPVYDSYIAMQVHKNYVIETKHNNFDFNSKREEISDDL